MSNGNVA
jgi:hypothetical protein